MEEELLNIHDGEVQEEEEEVEEMMEELVGGEADAGVEHSGGH